VVPARAATQVRQRTTAGSISNLAGDRVATGEYEPMTLQRLEPGPGEALMERQHQAVQELRMVRNET
jgi:hypothetical protein